ncbi:MAG: hypothetical protein AABY22_11380 [Nanoarchaeota archaeon]
MKKNLVKKSINEMLIKRYSKALEFYADFDDFLWENCEDDGNHGIRRCAITGTGHPREIARKALLD